MDRNIVIIGWGLITEILCEFPNVIGHTHPDDITKIVDYKLKKVICKVNREEHFGVIGIGNNELKKKRYDEWKNYGFKLGTLIHPTAFVSPNSEIMEGSVVMPLSFVDNRTSIGKGTIVGPQSAIRVASIGDFCHLSIQSKVLPNSKLGNMVFLGAGATILENIRVGDFSAIGSHSTVTKNVDSRTLYYEKSKEIVMKKIDRTYPLTQEEKLKKWNEEADNKH